MRNKVKSNKSIQALNDLGEILVKCNLRCEGINNKPKSGIIPRGLILEPREGTKSCVIVGLNPFEGKKDERNYYLEKGITYASIRGYFHDSNLKNKSYYKKTREMISLLGFDGDILWTDLVKCELVSKKGKLPVSTFRVCINRFLRKEIELFKNSTIIALGNDSFKFCALSFPNHFIIGLPHPNARGDFYDLKRKIDKNNRHFTHEISDIKDNNGNYKAIILKHIAK